MVRTAGSVLDLEIALAQCAIAFGRGAGNIGISLDAVQRLMRVFRPLIDHHLENWESESGRFLTHAEALGRLAAYIAVGKSLLLIDRHSVTKAMGALEFPLPCMKELKARKARR
jgi:hypothetical protein